MWIDPSEHMVRYLEYTLESEWGQGSRVVPITLVKIKERWVRVKSLNAKDFNGVPQARTDGVLTKLEEEKICGYYAGGMLYS